MDSRMMIILIIYTRIKNIKFLKRYFFIIPRINICEKQIFCYFIFSNLHIQKLR